MEQIKALAVCLDLSEQDDGLLDFAFYMGGLFPDLDRVVLVHNIKYSLPPELKEQLANRSEQLTDLIAEDLGEKAESIRKERLPGMSIKVVVKEDVATDLSIERSCREFGIDLVLDGKKPSFQGTGLVGSKLLRNLSCSIMFVPSIAYHQVTRLLVPVDFSKPSLLAFQAARRLQEKTRASFVCLHVYRLPERYFPYIEMDSMDEKLEKTAHEKTERFLSKITDLPQHLESRIVQHQSGSISKQIYAQAIKEKADLVVMGAQGNHTLAKLATGTVTESLSNMELHFPLLVVK